MTGFRCTWVLTQWRGGKTTAYRVAARRLHPDNGGDRAGWDLLQQARELLDGQLVGAAVSR